MNPVRRLRAVASRSAEAADATPLDRLSELLTAAGQGDERAFAAFYDEAAALIHGTVLRVVRDPAMSEEVTQEVFVELWRLAPRFDRSQGTARSWSATIAHRRAVDRVRSEEARRRRDNNEADNAELEQSDVADLVVERLDGGRVRDALEQLGSGQREAITLAYFGGHTYREVATLLDVPEGTVKTRIRDGLIKLRDQFGVEP